MPSPRDDEFYIGYEPVLPPGMRARLRRVTGVAAIGIAAATVVMLLAHGRLSPSRFDFGDPRDVAGVLERRPYPSLEVGGRRTWLVGQGKHGAETALASVGDGPVTLRGTAIERGPHQMLEVVTGSVVPEAPTPAAATRTGSDAPATARASAGPSGDTLRDVTLAGEIVDSKCFLGVMNPGEGTVHRDCASLCLRGGIPPMLLVRDAADGEALVLLVGRDGRSMSAALAPLAGVPVEVHGRLTRDARGLVLAADAADYRRLTR